MIGDSGEGVTLVDNAFWSQEPGIVQLYELMYKKDIIKERFEKMVEIFRNYNTPLDAIPTLFRKSHENYDQSLVTWETLPPKDPFSMSLSEYLSTDLQEAKGLIKQVYEIIKEELDIAWSEGYRNVIISNGKIVYKDKELKDISSKRVEEISKELNKACFVFSAPDIIEELPWSKTDYPDDYYPTIGVYLGKPDEDEDKIVDTSPLLKPDFDTGNPTTKAFDENQIDVSLRKYTHYDLGYNYFLGKRYDFFRKDIKMCVKDDNGKIISKNYTVRIVDNWDECSFKENGNVNRTGFIGRDIMLDMGLIIELDPITKNTRIKEISS